MKKSTAYVLLYFAAILTIAMLSSCNVHSIATHDNKTNPCFYDDGNGTIKPKNSTYRVTERYNFANPLKQD
jgi:hypothetical protein